MSDVPVRAVVFDMGGVLVRLAPLTDVLAGLELDADELWERWIRSDAVRRFEAGRCAVGEFAAELIDDLGVSLGPQELIERVREFPRGLFDGAEALVGEVRASGCIVAVLSNTNALHWEQQRDHERIATMFDRSYLSYEMGMVKPDAEIFQAMVDDLDVAAERILFLDDNQINVDGAAAVGIGAALARGPQEARRALVERGVLEGPTI